MPYLNSASVLLRWSDGRRTAVELLDGEALLVSAGDVRGRGDVTVVNGVMGSGDVAPWDGVKNAGTEKYGNIAKRGDVVTDGDVNGDVDDRDDVRRLGSDGVVGLVRLKARLAEKLDYSVWWKLRS